MAKLPFTTVQGADQTSSKITVLSLDSTTPSLTTSVGSVSTPTRVDVGTDGLGFSGYPANPWDSAGESVNPSGVAVYSWTFDITGLLPMTRGTYTATQGSNVLNGLFNTMPDESESEFMILDTNCDGVNGYTSSAGIWPRVRQLAEDQIKNVVAMFFTDDHGYVDSFLPVDPSGLITGNSRYLSLRPQEMKTAYAYAVNYALYLGLLEDIYSTDATPGLITSEHFHDPDRIWAYQNMPFIRTVGDHEVKKQFGKIPTTGPSATPTVPWLDVAEEAWKGTIGASEYYADPTHVNRHAATYNVIGPVEVIGLDRCLGLEPDLTIYDQNTGLNTGGVAAHNPPTVSGRRLGTAQMDAVQAKINNTSPIKFVLVSQVYWSSANLPERDGSAHGETVDINGDSEVTELFMGGGPRGYTGIAGQFSAGYNPLIVLVRGDLHHAQIDYHYKQPANSTQKPIELYDIVAGSSNGQFSQGIPLDKRPPSGQFGSHTVWLPEGINNETSYLTNDNTHRRYWCLTEFVVKNVGDGFTVDVNTYDAKVGQYLDTLKLDTRKTNAPEYLRYGTI